MIEHYVPLKLNHDEMNCLRDKWSRLCDLQTKEWVEGYEAVELHKLVDWFGGLDWLVGRIVNATETS